jgi:tRNA pseudouridine-54 N-methylase
MIDDKRFRLSINSLEGDSMNAIFIELLFDESSFELNFTDVEVPVLDKIKLQQKEHELPSLKVIDTHFTDLIEEALKEFEITLMKEFGDDVQFNFVRKIN